MSMLSAVWQSRLFSVLEAAIQRGALMVITPEKTIRIFQGSEAGTNATWQIHDWSVVPALAMRGDIGLGESYMEGKWDSPDLEALFSVFVANLTALDRLANGNRWSRWYFTFFNSFLRRNSVQGSVANIRAHYDVGNEFYRLWLDPTMTYSSALFARGDESLEEAQRAKYQRILDRIDRSRKRILEVGCGWGGFAEHATEQGHEVTAITISNEQLDFAKRRLGEKADIRFLDYRKLKGTFDAIASIEMFEAVGQRYWPDYFRAIKECLSPDGVAVIQTITIRDDAFDAYVNRGDFIRHYVFPGGLLPSIPKFKEQAERVGLACRDVFTFGKDYARTLSEWLQRFTAAESQIRALGYDERFVRSWRLYLAMCAAAFREGYTDVAHVELVHGYSAS